MPFRNFDWMRPLVSGNPQSAKMEAFELLNFTTRPKSVKVLAKEFIQNVMNITEPKIISDLESSRNNFAFKFLSMHWVLV